MSQPPFEASLTSTALTVFLNALAQCEQRGILLLDDYHAITSPHVQQTMTFFLAYLPASIHVILITRSEPPFPLSGLRARAELCEVRASDLRFSREETATFLQQMLPAPLAPGIVQRVHAHLEGWGAGLRLFLSALLTRISATQPDPAWPFSREILTLGARLAQADGDLVAVQRWVMGLDQIDGMQFPFASEQEQLLLARWHLAQGRSEEALRLLQDLERAAREAGRLRSACEAQALLAQVYAAHEQPEQSRHILLTLLEQACTAGYLRLFLDEGEVMAALLRPLALQVRQQPLLAYLQGIIRAFPGSQGLLASSPAALLAEPLSSQELRVLRLLVPGRSNAEIASELVVSVNTVRTHVQNIYRKLDVHNRAAAAEAARQLHLIA